ncbi:MAG: hypothetical protein ABEH43_08565 [Flavobacteriales bacterium]
MEEIVMPLADFMQWTFKFLPYAGNMPNVIFLLAAIFGVFYWLRLQQKYNKKAEESGGLK